MTSPRDERDQNDLERAAAETREPGEAARIRAEDDAETRARQADAGRELREAERTLRDTGRRLHADGDAAGAIERDVERTRDLTREVAERARELRADTARTADRADDITVDLERGDAPR